MNDTSTSTFLRVLRPLSPVLNQSPMQLGQVLMSLIVRQCCLQANLCRYSGEPKHVIATCLSHSVTLEQFSLPVLLSLGPLSVSTIVIMDSEAAGNFIDQCLTEQLGRLFVPLKTRLSV